MAPGLLASGCSLLASCSLQLTYQLQLPGSLALCPGSLALALAPWHLALAPSLSLSLSLPSEIIFQLDVHPKFA